MLIDKVGGISPPYYLDSKKAETKATETTTADQVMISGEAIKQAEKIKTKNIILSSVDPERVEKLRDIKEKLNSNEYDNLTKEQLGKIADSVMKTFFG